MILAHRHPVTGDVVEVRRQRGAEAPLAGALKQNVQTPVLDADSAPAMARIIRSEAGFRWTGQQLSSITPQYVETTLRGALAGDHLRAWELFDLMEDTWPRLRKNVIEIKDAVCNLTRTFEPWAEDDSAPTPQAEERARLVSSALRGMRPAVTRDEHGLDGVVRDVLDARFKGISVQEVGWESRASGKMGSIVAPRAAWWVHPSCYGWSSSGELMLNVADTAYSPVYAPSVGGVPFPPDKFLIAINKTKTGSPLGGALLRPLAWWWCAGNFSADWLLNLAQIFGLPFRWANYANNSSTEVVDKICDMLANMGSAGWAAFPEGTKLELKAEGMRTGDATPQGNILDRADKACDLLILGQTLTGDSGGGGRGGGSLALGKVHEVVKYEIVMSAAKAVCSVINEQLIPSVVRLNYGDETDLPRLCMDTDDESDLTKEALIVKTLKDAGAGHVIGLDWLGQKFGIPKPGKGEETLEDRKDKSAAGNPNAPKGSDDEENPLAGLRALCGASDEEFLAALKAQDMKNGALKCSSAECAELLCHFSFALPDVAGNEIMYMPAGVQEITPSQNGKPVRVRVMVDESGARALEAQRLALTASGRRPYFDFNHDDEAASFWPTEFFWRPDGIWARGEWTRSGREGVEGKEWRAFSPVFHVDDVHAAQARIVARSNAKPNMGGLVNDPAFRTIAPFWAKDSSSVPLAENNQNQNTNMKPEEIAALQAKNKQLEQELADLRKRDAELKAKNETDAVVAAEIRAKQAEHDANAAKLESESLRARNAELSDAAKKRAEADADSAVSQAVARGAIAAKDDATQAKWKRLIVADPANAELLAKMPGNPALSQERQSPPSVQVTGEAPNAKVKAYAAIVARNAEIPMSRERAGEKAKLAREAGALFAKDLEKDAVVAGMTLDDAIKAADFSNAQVGLLSGTLVLQRALPLLAYEYPMLGMISTDMSAEAGVFNQTETTRIVVKPAVQEYDSSADSSGRPKGWATASPAQTVDVAIKLDKHVGIPIVFGQATLGSTVRNLFDEQAPAAMHALGGYAVDMLTALLTAGNFNAYAATSVGTGATTNGDETITVASTASMYPGQRITGAGIPTNTYVASITNGTTAELTQKATATASGLTFTLSGGKVPDVYATYAKALADFNAESLGDIRAALTTNEVPSSGRFVLLNPSYHARLGRDPILSSFFAAVQRPEIVTAGSLPPVQGFQPIEAPWMPSSSNRVGFAGHKASLLFKSRLPVDFTTALGTSVPGSTSIVTAPGGISVMLVQYVDMRGGFAEWRPEVLLGAALGDRRCGLVLTSE